MHNLELVQVIEKNRIEDLLERLRNNAIAHFSVTHHVDSAIERLATFMQANVVAAYRLLDTKPKYRDTSHGDREELRHL